MVWMMRIIKHFPVFCGMWFCGVLSVHSWRCHFKLSAPNGRSHQEPISQVVSTYLRWGSLCPLPLLFLYFSELSRHSLPIGYHFHIWQVSPQLSCGDTCQIWMEFKGVSESLNLTVFLGTVDIEVHIVHISCAIVAYTLESLSSLT